MDEPGRSRSSRCRWATGHASGSVVPGLDLPKGAASRLSSYSQYSFVTANSPSPRSPPPHAHTDPSAVAASVC